MKKSPFWRDPFKGEPRGDDYDATLHASTVVLANGVRVAEQQTFKRVRFDEAGEKVRVIEKRKRTVRYL